MRSYSIQIDPLTREEYCDVNLRGAMLLEHPLLNKGAAFTEEERQTLGLTGILRSGVNSLQDQVERALENYQRKTTDLERYIYLQSLQDRNETLFFALLCANLEQMLPIVYTPVVGEACQKMSHIMRHYRGVYVSPDNIRQIDHVFDDLSQRDLSLIVVTDGERILGLGDLGSDGMGIPVGKVNLYVAAGGLHPSCCLPVCLDVGTNNAALLDDPMYLGYRHPRLTGSAYDELVERFILGVRRCFPHALLQWEDFAKHQAFKLLHRYRERIPSFNDDIQGTGATALAALLTALEIKEAELSDQIYVIVGMGQAGVGIANNIRTALEQGGLGAEEARERIMAVDERGLLLEDTAGVEPPQRPHTQRREVAAGWTLAAEDHIGLEDVIKNARATVLIGATGKTGLFDEAICSGMAKNTDRPVIMALSNPTSKSECTPMEVARYTDGRALVATGSPFAPFSYNGRTLESSQCNNLYVFPGVGLGLLVSKTLKVTDRMFMKVSRALSGMVSADQRARGLLLPPMSEIRRVSFEVAKAVAVEAREAKLGRQLDDDQMAAVLSKAQWSPHYLPFRAARS